jgi:hypothetical protein
MLAPYGFASNTDWPMGSTETGSVAKLDFCGKIQKSGIRNSTTYRLPNSRKSDFATEPPRAPIRLERRLDGLDILHLITNGLLDLGDCCQAPVDVARSTREALVRWPPCSTSRCRCSEARPSVLSQSSIFGAKSNNLVSEIQWLRDSRTLEKVILRQNRCSSSLIPRPIRPSMCSARSLIWFGRQPRKICIRYRRSDTKPWLIAVLCRIETLTHRRR